MSIDIISKIYVIIRILIVDYFPYAVQPVRFFALVKLRGVIASCIVARSPAILYLGWNLKWCNGLLNNLYVNFCFIQIIISLEGMGVVSEGYDIVPAASISSQMYYEYWVKNVT